MENRSLRERLADKYDDSALVRGLVQLIPAGIGSAIETAFLTLATNLRERRVERLFDALANENLTLTEDSVKNDEFIHKFLVTLAASARTNRKEKIDLFAAFLKNGSSIEVDADEFDELLLVLDELSLREFMVLEILDRHERATPRVPGENDLQHANLFWDSFQAEVVEKLGVPIDAFDPFMTRLVRTGTYETFVGGYMDYTGGKGKLTPIYCRLKYLCTHGHSE